MKDFSAFEGFHQKLALEIKNLDELLVGHAWWQEGSQSRSFLPRSGGQGASRFTWYRQLFGPRMKWHWLRQGGLEHELADQPLLFDEITAVEFNKTFAAVLGDPVSQSRTPQWQKNFFKQRGQLVLALPMGQLGRKELRGLFRLGLRQAAVTAPLKTQAFAVCDAKDEVAQNLGSVNTLKASEAGEWQGSNTDQGGLKSSLQLLELQKWKESDQVVLWGGGGTQAMVKSVFPMAKAYSAREGKPRDDSETISSSPDFLIWAVGRSRQPHCQWPPRHWNPKVVYDLNYTEDSPGREYALRVGAQYYGGMTLFAEQARLQRSFWEGRREE